MLAHCIVTWPDGKSLHRVSPKIQRPRNVDIGVGMHTEKYKNDVLLQIKYS